MPKPPPIGNNNWRCGAADRSYTENVVDPSGAAHVITSTEETDNCSQPLTVTRSNSIRLSLNQTFLCQAVCLLECDVI